MMCELYDIYVYAPEGPPIPGATLVQCLSDHARKAIFGSDDTARLPDWPTDAQTRLFNIAASSKVLERADKKDLVLLSGGWTHKSIADLLPEFICCEPFVGYEGILTEKCAFESYAWMHYLYGKKGIHDIRWYDRVIHPFVDPDEFPEKNTGDGDFLLFLGRFIDRKGPHIAKQIAKAVGLPLKIAGAGQPKDAKEEGVEYLGPVDVKTRAELLSKAKALICPTIYCEPGGNVAIEAMMAGCPALAPDWGVFSETIPPGRHFRTLKQAAEIIQSLDNDSHIPMMTREWAKQFSLDAIRPKFSSWFSDLSNLWEKGWETL